MKTFLQRLLLGLSCFCTAPALGQEVKESQDDPPPARRIVSWTLEGDFLEPKSVLRNFLEPVIEENSAWQPENQQATSEFLAKMSYESSFRTQPSGANLKLVVTLQPQTLVRHVVVDIAIGVLDRLAYPVFSQDLRRRMTLRPGSPLAKNPTTRKNRIQQEADRLAFYLHSEGFFDARVQISEKKVGKYASRLEVSADPGDPYKVGKITVTGNNAVPTAEITKLFRHRRLTIFEKSFTREQLQQDIERLVQLYQKRGYPGVRVRTDFDMRQSFNRATKRVDFRIEVRERRKIDIVFEGLKDDAPVDNLMKQLTLNEEGSYDDLEVDASAEAIRRYYQRNGRYEASVTWQRVPFGVFERILFEIDEGPQLPVREVIFRGNSAISNERLAKEVKTQVFRRIIIGESGGYLTSVQLRQDLRRIEAMYKKLGYDRVTVTPRVARGRQLLSNAAALAASVAGSAETDGLYVLFTISEGPLVRIANVKIKHDDKKPRLSLPPVSTIVNTKPGIAFVSDSISTDANALARYYFSRGYPRAKIQPEVVPTNNPGLVDVVFHVVENNPASIGKIALRGNFKTKRWVIEDELQYREGDPLTIEAAEEAQSSLRNSGLFSSVNLDYRGLDSPRQDKVNVVVSIQERHDNSGELQAGFGFATDTRLFGEAQYRYQNIAGTGANFSLRGILGQQRQLLEARLGFPRWIPRRLVGTPFLLELSSFYQLEQTPRFGDLTSLGATIGATKQGRSGFFKGWLLSFRYDFRSRNRDEDLVRVSGQSSDLQSSPVVTISSAIGPQLVIDKRRDRQGRRNPLTPTGGYRLEFRALFGEDFLVGSNRFIKVSASGQHFLGLGKHFLISNGLRYDHGFPLGGAVVLPEVERFFAGGDTTVRGFEEDRLATEIIQPNVGGMSGIGQFRILPAGGNIRMIHNLELQVILANLKFPIASAIFLDSGFVENSFDGFKFKDLRHSIGLALARAVLPFGSLSVEYAFPLDPVLGDDPQGRLHVNLGLLF